MIRDGRLHSRKVEVTSDDDDESGEESKAAEPAEAGKRLVATFAENVNYHSATDDESDGKDENREEEEDEDTFQDSEEEEGYHDVDRAEHHLDYVPFVLPNPLSEESLVQVPLWTVSIQGIEWNHLRQGDQRYLSTLPKPVVDAVLALRSGLDPLDMDVPLPAFSPNVVWILFAYLFALVARWVCFIRRYFESEWRRYRENLELLRARDWPGYVPVTFEAPSEEQLVESHAQVPTCLPSMANLEKLLSFNKLAREYNVFATLVRTERSVPGSRLIGFRLQLTRIENEPHEINPHASLFFAEPVLLPQTLVSDSAVLEPNEAEVSTLISSKIQTASSFDEIAISDQQYPPSERAADSIASVPSIVPNDDRHETENRNQNQDTKPVGLSLHSLFHHIHLFPDNQRHLPPLLLHRIEGQADLGMSTSQVLGYASHLGFA